MIFKNLTQEQYSLMLDEWHHDPEVIKTPIPLNWDSETDTVTLDWTMVGSDKVRSFLKSIGLEEI